MALIKYKTIVTVLMLCIGHRGAMGYEPENTLRSISLALSLNADWIEVDVYNIENNLIVLHDRDLSRTTNGTGYIEEHSLTDLRLLDAGQGEQIPLLEEVCDRIDRKSGLNIELKGFNTAKLVVELIHKYLDRGWQYRDFLVSSFNHYELQTVRQVCPEIPLGLLIYGIPLNYLEIAEVLKVKTINFSLDFVNKNLVKNCHDRGFQVFVYTVNKLEDINYMKQLKVDGVFTNYPDRVFLNDQ
jgi:glycerophosphoryl diester phosphodiesterase